MKALKKVDATKGDTTPRNQRNALPPELEKFKWEPGKSANPAGRPKGTRNKLGEAFLLDMLSAWEVSGKAAIEKVIDERPHEFIKTVASILPKEVNVNTTAVQEMSDDELSVALSALRSAIAASAVGDGSKAPSRH